MKRDSTTVRLLNRLSELIESANCLICSQQRVVGTYSSPTVDRQGYQRWRTSSESLIVSICGVHSLYHRNFTSVAKPSAYVKNVTGGKGVLLAVKDDIASGCIELQTANSSPVSVATVENASVNLRLSSAIYSHIAQYLDTEDYFHAVEEAYKVVRKKLKETTGEEKASDVFNANAESNKYHKDIFGKKQKQVRQRAISFGGVGYLNLAIQFLRNEKSHTLATTLDKNLAIHYISLANLVYDLISARSNEK